MNTDLNLFRTYCDESKNPSDDTRFSSTQITLISPIDADYFLLHAAAILISKRAFHATDYTDDPVDLHRFLTNAPFEKSVFICVICG